MLEQQKQQQLNRKEMRRHQLDKHKKMQVSVDKELLMWVWGRVRNICCVLSPRPVGHQIQNVSYKHLSFLSAGIHIAGRIEILCSCEKLQLQSGGGHRRRDSSVSGENPEWRGGGTPCTCHPRAVEDTWQEEIKMIVSKILFFSSLLQLVDAVKTWWPSCPSAWEPITAVQNFSQFCDLITCELAPPDGHPVPLQPHLCNVSIWACFITCVVHQIYSFLAISLHRYKMPFHCVTNNRTCCLQQIALTEYLKGMLDTAQLPLDYHWLIPKLEHSSLRAQDTHTHRCFNFKNCNF